MKKYLVIVFPLFMLSGIFAQSGSKTDNEKSYDSGNYSLGIKKSVAEIEYILDSTITVNLNFESGELENQYRETFTYDSLGNSILYMRDKWLDEESSWIYLEKRVQEFNEQNLLSGYEQCFWQAVEAYWQGDNKYILEYDENGNEIQYLSWQWNDDAREWIYRYNSLKEYDERGNVLVENIRLWDEEVLQWTGNVSVCKRIDYEYDGYNNEIQKVYYQWDANLSDWVYYMKDEHEYDTSGVENVFTSYLWDSEIGNWTKRYKQESSFDSLGNLVLDLLFGPDSLDNWLQVQKTEYTYAYFEDTALITLFERLNWETDSSRWKCVAREVSEVNENGKSVNCAYFDYVTDGDSLRLYQKFEWEYDQWGNMISEIRLRGFSESGELKLSLKRESEYDQDGNLTMRANFQWDETLNAWTGRNMETYSYNGDTETTISYAWDEVLLGWIETDKEVKTEQNDESFQYYYFSKESPSDDWQGDSGYGSNYDEYGNNTGNLEYDWDTISAEWYISDKTENILDYNITTDKVLMPDKYSYLNYSHKIDLINDYEWDTITNQLILSNIKSYYYSTVDNGSTVPLTGLQFMKIYPNPADNFIEIENAGEMVFEIVNIKGERVLRKNFYGTRLIDISAIKPGIYMVKAQSQTTSFFSKIIIKH